MGVEVIPIGLVIPGSVGILGSDDIGLDPEDGKDVDIPGKDVIGFGLEGVMGCIGLDGEVILDDVG